MPRESENKAIVELWFKKLWGNPVDLTVVDELGAPDLLMQYPLLGAIRGRENIKNAMAGFRQAFPDLNFQGVGDLIAEGDYVVGRWDGGGTHTGPGVNSLPIGSLPENSGRKMKFTGMTVFKVMDGKITEEIGEEDSLTALQQLGLVPEGNWPTRSST